jgi:hypothetical protein
MKKTLCALVVLSLVFLGTTCKKKETNKLTEFDIEYTTNLSVPSNSIAINAPAQTVTFTTPNIATEQSSKFSAQNTAQSLISEIKMTRFNVSAVGTGANLDYLKSLTLYIKAANVGEELVASKSNIPTGQTSVAMDLQDVNIKNFIFQDNIQFKVVATFDVSSTTPSQTLKLDQTVHVKATLLK